MESIGLHERGYARACTRTSFYKLSATANDAAGCRFETGGRGYDGDDPKV
jgi:hypothetical protein